jgi:hypothetical protein
MATESTDIFKTCLKCVSITNLAVTDSAAVLINSSNLHCRDRTVPCQTIHSLEIGFSENSVLSVDSVAIHFRLMFKPGIVWV